MPNIFSSIGFFSFTTFSVQGYALIEYEKFEEAWAEIKELDGAELYKQIMSANQAFESVLLDWVAVDTTTVPCTRIFWKTVAPACQIFHLIVDYCLLLDCVKALTPRSPGPWSLHSVWLGSGYHRPFIVGSCNLFHLHRFICC